MACCRKLHGGVGQSQRTRYSPTRIDAYANSMDSNRWRAHPTINAQSDVLAAAALILALLGVLYAVWYDEIKSALQLEPQPVRVSAYFESALAALWTRATP